VARWAPGARVVKAFNTTGAGNMADPRFGNEHATMFMCGDDAAAKRTVGTLAEALGFEAVDAGPLRQARLLEPLAMLWISLAYAAGHGPNIAFGSCAAETIGGPSRPLRCLPPGERIAVAGTRARRAGRLRAGGRSERNMLRVRWRGMRCRPMPDDLCPARLASRRSGRGPGTQQPNDEGRRA
jgi:hypothetical protein